MQEDHGPVFIRLVSIEPAGVSYNSPSPSQDDGPGVSIINSGIAPGFSLNNSAQLLNINRVQVNTAFINDQSHDLLTSSQTDGYVDSLPGIPFSGIG